jgi:hypothetical protein
MNRGAVGMIEFAGHDRHFDESPLEHFWPNP